MEVIGSPTFILFKVSPKLRLNLTFFMVSDFDGPVFSHHQQVVSVLLFPVDNSEGGMGRFSLPFRLFRLVICYCALLSADHNRSVDPANRVDHPHHFGVVKYYIDALEPLHGHIVDGYNNFFTIVTLIRLDLGDVICQMIHILFLATVSKTAQVASTHHVNVMLGYEKSLCVLKLRDEHFIVVI